MAWDSLLTNLKRQAQDPILIVYLPSVPQLNAGAIRSVPSDASTMVGFSLACARNAVAYLDLGPIFVTHFQTTGRFPRGFSNSPPGTGHLNEEGHHLVAEAVLNYLKEHRDAFLAP